MRRLRSDSLVESLPINEASALQLAKLPRLHSDPFDRIQISQSIEHSLILATPDPLIRQCAVRTVWD
jgi:PIN domain nuclease of toxin-antitoxin system